MPDVCAWSVWREVKCEKCGKIFIPAVNYRFKATINRRLQYYCSWTCYAHRKDKNAKDIEETRNKIINGE